MGRGLSNFADFEQRSIQIYRQHIFTGFYLVSLRSNYIIISSGIFIKNDKKAYVQLSDSIILEK